MPVHDVLRQRVQPLTAAMTSNRIFLYCVFSTFAVAATIANACRAHSNFYSVSIYLAKSSRSVLVCPPFRPYTPLTSSPPKVLANFGFICSLLFGRLLQKLFFGSLQPREVEVRPSPTLASSRPLVHRPHSVSTIRHGCSSQSPSSPSPSSETSSTSPSSSCSASSSSSNAFTGLWQTASNL